MDLIKARDRLHWLFLAALLVVPLLTPLYGLASALIERLLGLQSGHVRLEAAISRLLLFAWALAFVYSLWNSRISEFWGRARQLPFTYVVFAVSLLIIATFVIVFIADGINPVFASLRDSTLRPLPLLYKEDDFAEDMTVAFYLLGAGLLVYSTGPEWRVSRLNASLLIALAVCALLLVGEEISWGQRIFGWQTQGYFAKNNVQDETNLHNLLSWNVMAYVSNLAFAALIICSTYWETIVKWLRQPLMARLAPGSAVRMAIMVLPFTMSLVAYNELTEEVLSWLFFCYSWLRVRGHEREAAAGSV